MAPPTQNPSSHLVFVNQAVNTLLKVKEYINAGMETTMDVAQDLIGDDEVAHEFDQHRVSELKEVMLDYVRMERELTDFLKAVDHTTSKVSELDGECGVINLESILDQKLADLQAGYTEENLQKHEKYVDLLEKTSESQTHGAGGSDLVPENDEELQITQEETSLKCPYTGVEMVDPVQNKICKHSYEREGINEYMQRRGKKAKCPVGGCANTALLSKKDLVDNKSLKRLIERKGRQAGVRPKRGNDMFL